MTLSDYFQSSGDRFFKKNLRDNLEVFVSFFYYLHIIFHCYSLSSNNKVAKNVGQLPIFCET